MKSQKGYTPFEFTFAVTITIISIIAALILCIVLGIKGGGAVKELTSLRTYVTRLHDAKIKQTSKQAQYTVKSEYGTWQLADSNVLVIGGEKQDTLTMYRKVKAHNNSCFEVRVIGIEIPTVVSLKLLDKKECEQDKPQEENKP